MRDIRRAEGLSTQAGITSLKPVDQHPSRQKRDTSQEKLHSEILKAFAELKAAHEEANDGLEFFLDTEREMVVVSMSEHGAKRILRTIPFDELLRLAPLIKAKRQRLLDRVL